MDSQVEEAPAEVEGGGQAGRGAGARGVAGGMRGRRGTRVSSDDREVECSC